MKRMESIFMSEMDSDLLLAHLAISEERFVRMADAAL